jgi:hypothetical protein
MSPSTLNPTVAVHGAGRAPPICVWRSVARRHRFARGRAGEFVLNLLKPRRIREQLSRCANFAEGVILKIHA